MTVHVLHAGNGYDYLTRQVAHGDVTRGRGQELTDYYHQQGAPAGRWLGSGTAALGVAGTVEERQMKALFGEGLHPDAERIIQDGIEAGLTPQAAVRSAQLGRRFPQFATDRADAWTRDVDAEAAAIAAEQGRPEAPTRADRQAARDEVGRRWFRREHGREPADAGELKAHVAKVAAPARQPVAGYDLVFTPVKSVSVLWGVADHDTRRAIEAAHQAAVAECMAWLEKEAAFTRQGAGGVAQVSSRGLVATAFDHYDSRAGDPNLHTHVAVSNKVQGPDGRWRSLDGRVLHQAGVSASERYNSVMEREVTARLGVQFVERTTGRDRRPVREVDGIPEELLRRFSQRRDGIEARFAELRTQYRAKHGHDPSAAVQHRLAQQATLDTRGAKEAMESLATKRERWIGQAAAVIGERRLTALPETCRERATRRINAGPIDVEDLARRTVERVEADRSRWKVWHLRAEAERIVREVPGLEVEQARSLVEQVTSRAAGDRSILLEGDRAEEPLPAQLRRLPAELRVASPEALQREPGESVFRVHGSEWLSSPAIMAAEARLLDAARTPIGPVIDAEVYAAIEAAAITSGSSQLTPEQAALARHFAVSGQLVAVGVGAAGAGKTTSMRAFTEAVHATGGRVLALAPSAVAAEGLGAEVGAEAATLAKLLHDAADPEKEPTVQRGDVLLVDEAGMASTTDLDAVVSLARTRGAAVRLLGDPAQLSAVEAGGAFRLLVHEDPHAAALRTLHRFRDPVEADATLALRAGDTRAIDFYEDADRIREGSRDGNLEAIYTAWRADQAQGLTSLMLASDTDTARELSVRARLDRIADGTVTEDGARLHDGTTAGVADVVVTRRNDRRLATSESDYVKNGDLWTVQAVTEDGSLTLRRVDGTGTVTVPAEYRGQHVELGYASTIHRAQGVTVDRAHVLVDPALSREHAYVAATRGREANHLYVVTENVVDVDMHHPTEDPGTARQVLTDVLARESAEKSAHQTLQEHAETSESLARLVPELEYARGAFAASTGAVDVALDRAWGPDAAHQLREQPAWHALADRVGRLVEDTRDNPEVVDQVLTNARDRGPLDSAKDEAAVLAWRLDLNAPGAGVEEWAAYATEAAQRPRDERPPAVPTPESWVEARRLRIGDRINTLTDRAETEQPAWVEDLNLPDTGQRAHALRLAVAYRDRYDVTDTDSALGHEPTNPAQRRDWQTARDHIHATHAPVGGTEERAADIRQRAHTLPSADAPGRNRQARAREAQARERDARRAPGRDDRLGHER